MPEALLCTEQLASSDEEGRDTMAQAVQRCLGDLGPLGELGKPVDEGARGQSDVVMCPWENSHGPSPVPSGRRLAQV